jgi:hypothetical protein
VEIHRERCIAFKEIAFNTSKTIEKIKTNDMNENEIITLEKILQLMDQNDFALTWSKL